MANRKNVDENELDIGLIKLTNEGKVKIELLFEENLFTPLMMIDLESIADELQILVSEIEKQIIKNDKVD